MARVAQVGDFVQIKSAYNRSLEKTMEKVSGVDENGKTHTFAALATPHAAMSGAAMCIGNKCAMWRWSQVPAESAKRYTTSHSNPHEGAAEDIVRPKHVPESFEFVPYKPTTDLIAHNSVVAHWIEPEAEALARGRGWCGLAGAAR
jgi:hypothetical protein